jgi:hypothetical protein
MYRNHSRSGWPCPNPKVEYNKMKLDIAKKIKQAVKKYENELLIKAKTQPRLVHKYINSKRQIQHHITALEDNYGDIIDDKNKIAQMLNDYFSSVYTIENTTNFPLIAARSQSQMEEFTISTAEVEICLQTSIQIRQWDLTEFIPTS